MLPLNSSNAERTTTLDLAPGLSAEWLDDGALLVLTISNVSRPTVDAWADFISATAREWPSNRPWKAIYHFTGPDVALTPYVRQRAAELWTEFKDLRGREGIVLKRGNLFVHLVNLLLRAQSARVETRLFHDLDEACAWLHALA